jgi:hypothetical protein
LEFLEFYLERWPITVLFQALEKRAGKKTIINWLQV